MAPTNDSMEQGDREILEALGIGQGVTPLRAYAILGRRILELERLHRACHEGLAIPSRPPPLLPAPSNVPKVYEQRGIGGGRSESPFTEPVMDEIRPSARDLCECGHKRAQHVVHSRQCAYRMKHCPCTSFRLAL